MLRQFAVHEAAWRVHIGNTLQRDPKAAKTLQSLTYQERSDPRVMLANIALASDRQRSRTRTPDCFFCDNAAALRIAPPAIPESESRPPPHPVPDRRSAACVQSQADCTAQRRIAWANQCPLDCAALRMVYGRQRKRSAIPTLSLLPSPSAAASADQVAGQWSCGRSSHQWWRRTPDVVRHG